MSAIKTILGRQVWDSRGRPTVEVEVTLASGATGRAIAPSGASTGSREALDKRDGGRRLGGYGVNGALSAINGEIAGSLNGMEATDQAAIDAALIALDGTPQKTRLGGNAIVATSSAIAEGPWRITSATTSARPPPAAECRPRARADHAVAGGSGRSRAAAARAALSAATPPRTSRWARPCSLARSGGPAKPERTSPCR